MSGSRTDRPAALVRVSHASLGPAVEPGRRLAEALACVLGRPSALEKVRLVEVVGGSTLVSPLVCPSLSPVRVFTIEPGEGAGFVAMNPPAAFRLLDRALGGPPGRPQPARALTEVEVRTWRQAVGPLLQALQDLGPGALVLEEDPVETTGTVQEQESITWHFAWQDGPSCPGPSWRESRRQETPPWESPPEEGTISLGLDVVSARRWMDMVRPPPPDVSDALLDCVCRMTATLPLTVGRLETTVGGVAAWQPGQVVLLDTPADALWHASLGGVRFEGGPVSVAGAPHVLVTERRSDVPAPGRTPGPEARAGGGNRAHR